jgi:hypothetical protein
MYIFIATRNLLYYFFRALSLLKLLCFSTDLRKTKLPIIMLLGIKVAQSVVNSFCCNHKFSFNQILVALEELCQK